MRISAWTPNGFRPDHGRNPKPSRAGALYVTLRHSTLVFSPIHEPSRSARADFMDGRSAPSSRGGVR